MNFEDAKFITQDLLQKNGLMDWEVIIRGKGLIPLSYLGKCYKHKKTITYCAFHVKHSSNANVLDTIYHEVAHALAPEKEGHGRIWKGIAKQLGAVPKRCGSVTLRATKWFGSCCVCQMKDERKRKPKTKKLVFGYLKLVTPCPRLKCEGDLIWVQRKI